MLSSAFIHSALPHAAAILVFILACRAYLKQRSFGFLLLVFGFGIAAVLATSSLVTVCGGPSLVAEVASLVPGFWIVTIYGASACFLLGFLLLGNGGGGSASKGKSKGSADK
jgi:hypothetical protein